MGLEAKCHCRGSSGSGEVHALLEAHELILRGTVKRRIPIAEIRDLRVVDQALCFRSTGDEFVLTLGATMAQRWVKKITTPPPSLAKKLGIAPSSKVMVIGPLEDDTLRQALAGSIASEIEEARVALAVVRDTTALQHAMHIHATLPHGTPIWIVHGKGPQATFGEGSVRRLMRDAGYRDNKVSGVSDTTTATRYIRR
jgi:hypothetical protein